VAPLSKMAVTSSLPFEPARRIWLRITAMNALLTHSLSKA
jgi:hypothetical protein